ncbi:hypothetical protein Aduo_012472 [Ancylostoma duodenale]
MTEIFEFDVDYMCYSKDLVAQKLQHPGGDLLLLCGYRSSEEGLLCRLVPYLPFVDFVLLTDTFLIDTQNILRALTLDDRLRAGGHPFAFGTTLTFLLYSRAATKVFHYVNCTLQVDLSTVLDGSDGSISAKHARLSVFTFPQNPQWMPTLSSIPNTHNTERFVIVWEVPRRIAARRCPGKTKLFVLDLKLNVMRLIYSSLLKTDFVCLHPSGTLHTFIQTLYGMRMKTAQLNFYVHSLRGLCQQEIIRYSSRSTNPYLLSLFSTFSG